LYSDNSLLPIGISFPCLSNGASVSVALVLTMNYTSETLTYEFLTDGKPWVTMNVPS